MHELSIAYSLVEAAENAAREAGAQKITKVFLKIGKLSGVVKDALLFGFEIAAADTLLANTTLEIEELPVIVHCDHCARNVELAEALIFRCPICQNLTPHLIQGKELELVSLEINDE